MLVFIPCLGEFVIPSLLGGAENLMIGRVVWDEMFSSNNWPRACALAIVMIGGLISSTLLSRIITPVVYKLIPPRV
jgi:putrescine transport system permease protein